jgi:N-acetyl sugar amidotransferase
MIRYCKTCVIPGTKPDIKFDEQGICNACNSYGTRKEVDWDLRKKELISILNKYKKHAYWDCIIPVSGGKDSTYQVLKILEFGLRPLCVISSTCYLSEIGRKNIENIKALGVDVIEFSPDSVTRKKLNRIGLIEVGDISWPEHVGIFTVPVSLAVNFSIPLIIWGENSQNEYGGPAAASDSAILNRRWLEEFGGLLGLRVSDVALFDSSIQEKDLIPYQYPSDKDLERVGVTGLFLGYYLPWDGYSNALLAQAHGFHSYHTAVEGSTVSYENLDNLFHGIHDYFKFLKFGFGRATDQACLQVRRNRMTRDEAIQIVKQRDGKFPWHYLSVPLEKILSKIDLTVDEFMDVCDQFTNKDLFIKDEQGELKRASDSSLIKSNYDNVFIAEKEQKETMMEY